MNDQPARALRSRAWFDNPDNPDMTALYLERYLNYGLAIILAFIGAKLVLEAIHETTSLQVPVIPIWLSLTFIVVVLVVTAVTSLLAGPQAEEPDPARREPDTSTP